MNLEEKKQEMKELYDEAIKAEIALNQALIKLRSIQWPQTTDQEEIKNIVELAAEADGRAAFIIRALLVQHGNVLFM